MRRRSQNNFIGIGLDMITDPKKRQRQIKKLRKKIKSML